MPRAPDNAKLHELLKTAARELKATQQELADERDLHEQARKSLDQERARAREFERQLLDAQQALRKAQQQLQDAARESVTAAIPREMLLAAKGERTAMLPPLRIDPNLTLAPIEAKPAEDSTNVSKLDAEVMEKRVQALNQALSEAEADAKHHKQRAHALEAEVEALKELTRPKTAQTPALEITGEMQKEAIDAQLAAAEEAEKRLAAAEAELTAEKERSTQVMAKFDALEAELAAVRETAARAAELEGQLATAKARVWEIEQTKSELDAKHAQLSSDAEATMLKLAEQTARVSQLENELSGIRTRRDELNVELARLESDRKKLQTKLAELEPQQQAAIAAADAKRVDAEGLLAKEKEKHQHTAQRLLEARQKTRELEQQLGEAQQQLEAGRARETETANSHAAKVNALEAEHAQAIAQEREALQGSIASLQGQISQLEKDLSHATEEWHHTNRQYEQLHREMLVLLDQRDEARRQLEALRS